MVKIVRYSAGMTSKIFGFVESKKVAELMISGYSKEELTRIIEEQNLFRCEMLRGLEEQSIMYMSVYHHCRRKH